MKASLLKRSDPNEEAYKGIARDLEFSKQVQDMLFQVVEDLSSLGLPDTEFLGHMMDLRGGEIRCNNHWIISIHGFWEDLTPTMETFFIDGELQKGRDWKELADNIQDIFMTHGFRVDQGTRNLKLILPKIEV
jgi:hypothetical protein